MAHWSDPPVYIEPRITPVGTRITIVRPLTVTIYEKQDDGDWIIISVEDRT